MYSMVPSQCVESLIRKYPRRFVGTRLQRPEISAQVKKRHNPKCCYIHFWGLRYFWGQSEEVKTIGGGSEQESVKQLQTEAPTVKEREAFKHLRSGNSPSRLGFIEQKSKRGSGRRGMSEESFNINRLRHIGFNSSLIRERVSSKRALKWGKWRSWTPLCRRVPA